MAHLPLMLNYHHNTFIVGKWINLLSSISKPHDNWQQSHKIGLPDQNSPGTCRFSVLPVLSHSYPNTWSPLSSPSLIPRGPSAPPFPPFFSSSSYVALLRREEYCQTSVWISISFRQTLMCSCLWQNLSFALRITDHYSKAESLDVRLWSK